MLRSVLLICLAIVLGVVAVVTWGIAWWASIALVVASLGLPVPLGLYAYAGLGLGSALALYGARWGLYRIEARVARAEVPPDACRTSCC